MPDYIRIREWPPDHALKAYEDGYYIEAIQTLHGWMEVKLRELILLQRTKLESEKDEDFGKAWDVTTELSLNNIAKSLFAIGTLERDKYHDVLRFNRIRNNLIHKLFHEPYEKPYMGVPKQEFDEAFALGRNLADEIQFMSEGLV